MTVKEIKPGAPGVGGFEYIVSIPDSKGRPSKLVRYHEERLIKAS